MMQDISVTTRFAIFDLVLNRLDKISLDDVQLLLELCDKVYDWITAESKPPTVN